MDGDALHSIGDLARLTGLTVKTVRLYSDRGIVPPADRSPAGYRRYTADAVARLELARTLRELGLDLATIRKVVDREISVPDVAAAHAEALDVQIRTLLLRRAVLFAVAKRGASTPEEMAFVHRLARLSADERRRLVDEFTGAAFGGREAFAGIVRTMTPELPDEPSAEQVEAWVELAELAQDPGFQALMRRLADQHDGTALGRDLGAEIREKVVQAVAAGITPTAPEADPVVAAITARCPHGLLEWLDDANDPRRERYLRLLAVINGWSPPESLAPVLGWFTEALRTRTHP